MPDSAKMILKDWVMPILAAVLTAATIYGWAFEAQFNKEIEAHRPQMRTEVEQMLEVQKIEVERDRIQTMSNIERRLTRIETLLESMKEKR